MFEVLGEVSSGRRLFRKVLLLLLLGRVVFLDLFFLPLGRGVVSGGGGGGGGSGGIFARVFTPAHPRHGYHAVQVQVVDIGERSSVGGAHRVEKNPRLWQVAHAFG